MPNSTPTPRARPNVIRGRTLPWPAASLAALALLAAAGVSAGAVTLADGTHDASPPAAAPRAQNAPPAAPPKDADSLAERFRALGREAQRSRLHLARAGVDPDNIHAAVAAAAARTEEARAQRHIITARQMGIEVATARLTDRIEMRVEEDEVVRALSNSLDEHQAFLEKLPDMLVEWEWSEEYHAQKTTILDLKIALADRRATVAERFGASTVRRLESDAIDLDIRRREVDATIEMGDAVLKQMHRAITEYEMTRIELEREEERLSREIRGEG